MELYEALGRISEIRTQMVRTETFRGFRSLTVGFSGFLGIAAAAVQAERIRRPTEQIWDYVDLWVGVALVSLIVVGAELLHRRFVVDSPLKRRLTVLTIQQFAPCFVAGAAVTVIVAHFAQESVWMLPGLWAILFSMGVFASVRLLPRSTFWVGLHYMVSGTICLVIGSSSHSPSPWMMVGTFGIGQLLAAGILYYALERSDEQLDAKSL